MLKKKVCERVYMCVSLNRKKENWLHVKFSFYAALEQNRYREKNKEYRISNEQVKPLGSTFKLHSRGIKHAE